MAFYHRAYWSLRCRDPIAVNFHSQGWVNIPRLWKTFPLQFQYLVALKRVIFFLLVSSFAHSEEFEGWFLRALRGSSSYFPFAPEQPHKLVEKCGF